MTTITLSLVSHTNAGKTTLARTLLGADIGEVRDAPHVTEFASMHVLIETPAGDTLQLWDTPGFGDSARLVRRLRGHAHPLGWFLSTVWDRWRDRPFWASQQALRHVREDSDVLLYLVNAAERPGSAGYVEPEMDLLAWVGKPVLVLLNQMGPPRAAADEAQDVEVWRLHLLRWPGVHAVLPLDAFARCWVHELTLMRAVTAALNAALAEAPAEAPAAAPAAGTAAATDETRRNERGPAMARLADAWQARREATFAVAMQVLAASLARTAAARETVHGASSWSERLRRLGAALGQTGSAGSGAGADPHADTDPATAAQARLAVVLEAEVRASTAQLLALHGLNGSVSGEIISRVAQQFARHDRLPEGRAAVLGGALAGALTGLKADILSGGLTLGGGLLAGGLLGALGAAGVARGINVVRGTGQSWVAWRNEALDGAAQAALLRYLAVAHFGRGRGDWSLGEAPAHWPPAVAQALARQRAAWTAAWAARSQRLDGADDIAALAATLQPLLAQAAREVLTA